VIRTTFPVSRIRRPYRTVKAGLEAIGRGGESHRPAALEASPSAPPSSRLTYPFVA